MVHVFVEIINKVGYETNLAVSDNLLKWEPLGKVLPFHGTCWLSYLGGHQQGCETDLMRTIRRSCPKHGGTSFGRFAITPAK